MLIYFAHATKTPHVPHEGPSFWLLVASTAAVLLIGLWLDARKSKKPSKDES